MHNFIHDLPTELLQHTISFVPKRTDLRHLCETSKCISEVATPALYHDVSINISNGWQFQRTLSSETLCRGALAREYVRVLRLQDQPLCPLRDYAEQDANEMLREIYRLGGLGLHTLDISNFRIDETGITGLIQHLPNLESLLLGTICPNMSRPVKQHQSQAFFPELLEFRISIVQAEYLKLYRDIIHYAAKLSLLHITVIGANRDRVFLRNLFANLPVPVRLVSFDCHMYGTTCEIGPVENLVQSLNRLEICRIRAHRFDRAFNVEALTPHAATLKELVITTWGFEISDYSHTISGAPLDFWCGLRDSFPKLQGAALVLPETTSESCYKSDRGRYLADLLYSLLPLQRLVVLHHHRCTSSRVCSGREGDSCNEPLPVLWFPNNLEIGPDIFDEEKVTYYIAGRGESLINMSYPVLTCAGTYADQRVRFTSNQG